MDPHHFLHSVGGAAPTFAFRRAGFTRARLSEAVALGEIFRVRKGWYVCPEEPSAFRQAARVGGRVTGVTAARVAGAWVPPNGGFHVSLPHNAARPRTRDNSFIRAAEGADPGLILHWNDDGRGTSPFTVEPVVWLRQIIRDCEPAVAAAVADSAIRQRIIARSQWTTILESLPDDKRNVFSVVDGVPEAGTESVVRAALHMAGVTAVPQPVIGRRRGDLLVGDRLLLEIDSEEHHGGRGGRIRDAKRDRELVALGYIVIHFDYAEVIYDLPTVLSEVLALVRAGVHLRAA